MSIAKQSKYPLTSMPNMMSIKRQHPSLTYIAPILKSLKTDTCQSSLPDMGKKRTIQAIRPSSTHRRREASRIPISRNVCNGQWVPNAIPLKYVKPIFKAFDDLPRHYCFEKENGHGTDTKWADFLAARNKLIFMTQYCLALRPKETLMMRWSDIVSSSQIYIRGENNKLRKGRMADMPPQLASAIGAYRKKHWRLFRGSPFMFPSFRKGRRSPLTRWQWGRVFRDVLEIVGLDKPSPKTHGRAIYTPYSIRHTRATHLLETSDFDIFSVSNILGHGSPEMTMSYLPICPSFQTHFKQLVSQNLPF